MRNSIQVAVHHMQSETSEHNLAVSSLAGVGAAAGKAAQQGIRTAMLDPHSVAGVDPHTGHIDDERGRPGDYTGS